MDDDFTWSGGNRGWRTGDSLSRIPRPVFPILLARTGGSGHVVIATQKTLDNLTISLLYGGQSMDIAGQKPATVALLAIYRHTMPRELCRFPACARGH